jgi:hypothetical protein
MTVWILGLVSEQWMIASSARPAFPSATPRPPSATPSPGWSPVDTGRVLTRDDRFLHPGCLRQRIFRG